MYADALQHLEAEGRICPLKIEPSVPVHTGWDLGVSDSTAIWFIQNVGRSYHLIRLLRKLRRAIGALYRCAAREADQTSLALCQHFLPHDVKDRELNTAMSRLRRCVPWE